MSGAASTGGSRRIGRRRSGYTLVALLIAITIMSILLAAAGPYWSRIVQRDREDELIFRGGQYVEAIRIFQRRHGRLPMTLKELHEIKPRSIRRLYKDPITNSDDWGVIFQGGITSENLGGGGNQLGGALNPGGGSPPTGGGGAGRGGGPSGPAGSGAGFRPGQSGVVASGPIVGVYSKSGDRSLRVWNGRQRYSEWKFTIQGPGGGPGGPPGGGGPGGGGPGGGGPVGGVGGVVSPGGTGGTKGG